MHPQTHLLLLSMLAIVACKSGDQSGEKIGNDQAPTAPRPSVPSPEPQRSARPALERAEPLPKIARRLLEERMQSHGDDMEHLLWSALMLDHESTAAITNRMSSAPTLARPNPGMEDTLNAMLPPEFFALQTELGTSMAALEKSALAGDSAAVAEHYGQIVQTCIRCHDLYLDMPVPEEQ